jgi:uncharacterized BrkB/YihY/UPF0761 family membrane protein
MDSSGSAVEISLILVIVVIGLVSFGLWLWSIIHCVTNKRLTDTNRIIGIVLIVVLGLLGSLIYLFLPREEAAARGGLPAAGG